jgi:hypothetical protein
MSTRPQAQALPSQALPSEALATTAAPFTTGAIFSSMDSLPASSSSQALGGEPAEVVIPVRPSEPPPLPPMPADAAAVAPAGPVSPAAGGEGSGDTAAMVTGADSEASLAYAPEVVGPEQSLPHNN